MKAIGSNAGNEQFKRRTMNYFSPLRVGVFLLLTLLMGPVSLHAGKPAAKIPKLESGLCFELGGTWTLDTCTIAGGDWGQATSSFVIPDRVSLVIQGDGHPPETEEAIMCTFLVEFGVTLENYGLIRIETTGGLGFCNLGTLKNAGNIQVGNASTQEGYGNLGLINLATITNSGTIAVKNLAGYYSTGIFNAPHIPEFFDVWAFDTLLPTITNTGSIFIENNGYGSTGIRNEGALSNAGNITASAGIWGHYGLSNEGGTFTNEASGTLVNNYGDPLLVPPTVYAPTYGVANFSGTMINYGSVTNNGVLGTDGWAMLTYGTLNNYGVLFQSDGVLVNYGTVRNWGAILTDGYPDYPHNQGVCENLPNDDGTSGSGC